MEELQVGAEHAQERSGQGSSVKSTPTKSQCELYNGKKDPTFGDVHELMYVHFCWIYVGLMGQL